MSDISIIIESNEDGTSTTNCEISIKQRNGGSSNAYSEKRGIQLTVTFCEITQHDGYVSKRYSPMEKSNFRYLLEENKRLNRKRIQKIIDAFKEVDQSLLLEKCKDRDVNFFKSIVPKK